MRSFILISSALAFVPLWMACSRARETGTRRETARVFKQPSLFHPLSLPVLSLCPSAVPLCRRSPDTAAMLPLSLAVRLGAHCSERRQKAEAPRRRARFSPSSFRSVVSALCFVRLRRHASGRSLRQTNGRAALVQNRDGAWEGGREGERCRAFFVLFLVPFPDAHIHTHTHRRYARCT